MEHQTLGRRFVCPIGPATQREFILDWRISTLASPKLQKKDVLNKFSKSFSMCYVSLNWDDRIDVTSLFGRVVHTVNFSAIQSGLYSRDRTVFSEKLSLWSGVCPSRVALRLIRITFFVLFKLLCLFSIQ